MSTASLEKENAYVPFIDIRKNFIDQPYDSLAFDPTAVDSFFVNRNIPDHLTDVQIKAHWGWSYIPEAVKEATKLIAHRYIMKFEFPFGPDRGLEINIATAIQGNVGNNNRNTATAGRAPFVDFDVYDMLDEYIYKGIA